MITLNAAGNHYHATVEEGDTAQLRRILVNILPVVMDRFAAKNRSYGENAFDLGAAGQFPEIDRKVKKLRALIWDERQSAAVFEGAQEVIEDLIGHLLMLLDCLDSEAAPVQGQASTDATGHAIRESKGGIETWVSPA